MWRGGGISDLAQWRGGAIELRWGPRLVTLISRDAALHDATGCVSDAPTTRQHRQSSNNLFSSLHAFTGLVPGRARQLCPATSDVDLRDLKPVVDLNMRYYGESPVARAPKFRSRLAGRSERPCSRALNYARERAQAFCSESRRGQGTRTTSPSPGAKRHRS